MAASNTPHTKNITQLSTMTQLSRRGGRNYWRQRTSTKTAPALETALLFTNLHPVIDTAAFVIRIAPPELAAFAAQHVGTVSIRSCTCRGNAHAKLTVKEAA